MDLVEFRVWITPVCNECRCTCCCIGFSIAPGLYLREGKTATVALFLHAATEYKKHIYEYHIIAHVYVYVLERGAIEPGIFFVSIGLSRFNSRMR